MRAAEFGKNDFVWVLDTATLKGVSKKLSNRWKGPYKIIDVIDDANFRIKSLTGKKTLMVNKCKLKRCFERKILKDDKQNLDTIFETEEENQPSQNKIAHTVKNVVPDKLVELSKKLKSKKKKVVKAKSVEPVITKKVKGKIVKKTVVVDDENQARKSTRIRREPDRYQAK